MGFGDSEKEVENTNDTVKNFIDECEAGKCFVNILSKYDRIVIFYIIKNEKA